MLNFYFVFRCYLITYKRNMCLIRLSQYVSGCWTIRRMYKFSWNSCIIRSCSTYLYIKLNVSTFVRVLYAFWCFLYKTALAVRCVRRITVSFNRSTYSCCSFIFYSEIILEENKIYAIVLFMRLRELDSFIFGTQSVIMCWVLIMRFTLALVYRLITLCK